MNRDSHFDWKTSFSNRARSLLAVLAIFGALVPNGVFLWVAFTNPDALWATMADPVALVFIGEAFLLMFFFAWLIHRGGWRPGPVAFVVMSLLGSLAFSVPAWLWLASRPGSRDA